MTKWDEICGGSHWDYTKTIKSPFEDMLWQPTKRPTDRASPSTLPCPCEPLRYRRHYVQIVLKCTLILCLTVISTTFDSCFLSQIINKHIKNNLALLFICCSTNTNTKTLQSWSRFYILFLFLWFDHFFPSIIKTHSIESFASFFPKLSTLSLWESILFNY